MSTPERDEQETRKTIDEQKDEEAESRQPEQEQEHGRERAEDEAVAPKPAPAPIEDDINFAAPTTVNANDEEEQEEDDNTYPEPTTSHSLVHPPDFKPFFTLISSSPSDISEAHHHPSVHYIFSDDDPAFLTSAALETLSTTQPPALLDRTIPDERFVIVDLSADGKEIVGVESLSPEWQGLRATVGAAPSWDGGSGGRERGLMLRICGQEVRERNGKRKRGDLDSLIKEFDECLESLDGVLGEEGVVDTHDGQRETAVA